MSRHEDTESVYAIPVVARMITESSFFAPNYDEGNQGLLIPARSIRFSENVQSVGEMKWIRIQN